MSQHSDPDDGPVIIMVVILGVIVAIVGAIYSLFTTIASALGDCTPQFQESLIENGGMLLFGQSPAPAFVEGVKISMEILGVVGIAIMGLTWWWSKKQSTTRLRRTSQSRKNWMFGLYVVGFFMTIGGLGTALSIAVGAQTACVGGLL